MLLLNDLAPWHWAAGGAGIAVVTLLLLFVANHRLGISTSFESVCSLVSRRPYFGRAELRDGGWRLVFLLGLFLGGLLSALSSGGLHPTFRLGLFDSTFGAGPIVKLAWMFVGGLCIGFGTRLAGGCTSGHGIFGLSNFERASLVTTVSFMAAGIATTNVIYRLIGA